MANTSFAFAQFDSLRVMYYNILNFPINGDPDREEDFRIINLYVKPDIILVNEVVGDNGAVALLNQSLNVYGETAYQKAAFTNGPSTNNMLFYNSDKLALHSQWYITTDLRHINEYVLYYKLDDQGPGIDTIFLYFYSAHLKADENEPLTRLAEVEEFRERVDNLTNPENIFFGGDLNLYHSSEPAYIALTEQGTYPLNDPLPAGNWHNNYSLRHYHTQSTRTNNIGGGASGGLDDRFDFILFSNDVENNLNKVKYIPNSCLAFGNDGNHFNLSLIDPPLNTSVPDSVLNALFSMSDHLPVICDLEVETGPAFTNSKLVITEIMYNPPEAGMDSLEFIEIYNNGSVNDTLTGYYLEGVGFTFPELILEPGEYFVSCVNSQAMLNTFGITAFDWIDGALLNSGELIVLYDDFGNVIDSVHYLDDVPWPVQGDGFGSSIIFCNPDNDNALGENWQASENFITNNNDGNPIYASPGTSECGFAPIADFNVSSTAVNEGGNVSFTDFSLNNPSSWSWTFTGGTPSQSSLQNPIITYTIPGVYNVQLAVSNDFGDDQLIKENYITVFSNDPVIIITEILQNPYAVSDSEGEWFEVYNPTSFPIDLLNWKIKDNDLDEHTISSSVIVPPNGFTVLGRKSNSSTNGDYDCDYQYSDFYLSNSADEIVIYNPENEEIDRIEYDGSPYWPDPNGASMVFIGGAGGDNNDFNQWQVANEREDTFTGTIGDLGSPGTNGNLQNIQKLGFDLTIKVFLEGPFNGNEMEAYLNVNNLIPLQQPFNISPWYYSGSESVQVFSDPDVVDWVLIEIRDATDANSAIASTRIDRTAALLKKDGSIVDINGNSPIYFNHVIANDLFVVVNHRNHLNVLSANPLFETEGVYFYDYTSGNEQAYKYGQNEIGINIWGMASGDCDASGMIDLLDKNIKWKLQSGTSGYLESDLNMDTSSDNQDKNNYWLPNMGKSSQVPD